MCFFLRMYAFHLNRYAPLPHAVLSNYTLNLFLLVTVTTAINYREDEKKKWNEREKRIIIFYLFFVWLFLPIFICLFFFFFLRLLFSLRYSTTVYLLLFLFSILLIWNVCFELPWLNEKSQQQIFDGGERAEWPWNTVFSNELRTYYTFSRCLRVGFLAAATLAISLTVGPYYSIYSFCLCSFLSSISSFAVQCLTRIGRSNWNMYRCVTPACTNAR